MPPPLQSRRHRPWGRSNLRVCGAGDVGEFEFVGAVDGDKLQCVHESSYHGPGRGRASAARPPLLPLYYIRMKGQNGPQGPANPVSQAPLAGLDNAHKGPKGVIMLSACRTKKVVLSALRASYADNFLRDQGRARTWADDAAGLRIWAQNWKFFRFRGRDFHKRGHEDDLFGVWRAHNQAS